MVLFGGMHMISSSRHCFETLYAVMEIELYKCRPLLCALCVCRSRTLPTQATSTLPLMTTLLVDHIGASPTCQGATSRTSEQRHAERQAHMGMSDSAVCGLGPTGAASQLLLTLLIDVACANSFFLKNMRSS